MICLAVCLSVISLVSSATIEQLKWQPDLITKESILRDHMKLSNETVFDQIQTLAFVTQWNPRGFLLAKKRASRLNFVSNVWFEVVPQFGMENMENVVIRGERDINRDFIGVLRKTNPDIKIVPRFLFNEFSVETTEYFVRKEVLVQKVGQKIANLCLKHGFDGLVVDGFAGFFPALRSNKVDTIEMLIQLGNVFKRNGLVSILSFPTLVGSENLEDGKQITTSPLTPDECTQLSDPFDIIQLWTYSDGGSTNRHLVHDDYLIANMRLFGFSPKLMLGMNLYGIQYPLDEYRAGPPHRRWNAVTSKEFLRVLRMEDAVLTWNSKNKEHELVSESANTFILFPSLTTLEYRIALAKEHNVGVAFWDYGQGLDYFTNLV